MIDTIDKDSIDRLCDQISTLLDTWSTAPTDSWELSEPFFVGGAASNAGILYSCRAPFVGPCQYMVDFATAGSTATHLVVSSNAKRAGVDFTGNLVNSYQDSQMDALVLFAPPSQTVPISTSWYDVRNSENTIYVLVVANNNAAGCNIQFRQKRKAPK